MILKKHSSKIIIALMGLAVAACILASVFAPQLTELAGGMSVDMEYESALFDTDKVIDINIEMDSSSWNDMLSNAINEEYYACNVIINGTKVNNVAIRPKGNTSLMAIVEDPDSDRFSLKLEFDHFVDGQTCYGLDKLILNNNFADATNMKEAVIYDMYQFLDADASLYNYAKVSVNGEYWGVYIALEGIEDSFMLRNYGTQDGELYKPDPADVPKEEPPMGQGMEGNAPPDGQDQPAGGPGFGPGPMPGMGGLFGPSPVDESTISEAGGASLRYINDDLDSYPVIWACEVTSTSKTDHRKVVTALKNISEGKELEKYLDVDNVLKYMAVHTFSVNMDSLSSDMTHNYYLYESGGRLNIFPWDYNLSFGGVPMAGIKNGTEVINYPVDTPFQGTDFFDALLENDEYCSRYHEYLRQLVDEYVNGGRFDATYNHIRSSIDSLVKDDPTSFYSYGDYQTAAEMLYKTVKLRAESIDGQLNGSVPATGSGQEMDPDALIDGSSVDVVAMGQFSNSHEKFEDSKEHGDSSDDRDKHHHGDKTPTSPGNQPPELAGALRQALTPDSMKNLLTYTGLFLLMILAVIGIKQIKRRQ